jgi:hypothetical protein
MVIVVLIFFLIIGIRFLITRMVREWNQDHCIFCTTYKIKAIFYLQSSAIIFRSPCTCCELVLIFSSKISLNCNAIEFSGSI